MKRAHLDALKPVCPLCRRDRAALSPLGLASVFREREADGTVIEGVLLCPEPACRREYPIVDGVPLLIAPLRAFIAQSVVPLLGRSDLSPEIESIVGDCCGPGSAFDVVRHHVGTYAWDHYGDLDPDEPAAGGLEGGPGPGSVLRVLDDGLGLVGADLPEGPVLDIGCSVGRSSFALAERTGRLVVGVDMNVAMLRVAARVLGEGRVRYPLRRVGVVYERRDFAVDLAGADAVDFWCCDATLLPFAPGTFAVAASVNVLDCVQTPRDHLAQAVEALAPGGALVVATPFDWAAGATPFEQWIGGHSQRGDDAGRSEAFLAKLLGGDHPAAVPDVRVVAVRDADWHVRVHDRHTAAYRTHLVVARREAPAG